MGDMGDMADPEDLLPDPVQAALEAPKGILKNPTVRFPSKVEDKDNTKEDEIPERRNKKRYSQESIRTSRSSLASWYLPEEGTLSTFSALIVLKMIFFDIGISFGDAVTDVAQGITLIADFSTFPPQYKDLTYQYGVMVLVVCWIPGLVAVIHIMSHYRHEYFGLAEDIDVSLKKERRKNFILVIVLCLTIYPLVPTISYCINIWYLGFGRTGDYNMKTAKLEMLARVSHSIAGCIEAPFQLILTSLLIMLGVLPEPWKQGITTNGISDGFKNQIPLTSIPMWTLLFSLADILKCAVMINIFNVYVGQLTNYKTFKRYINLVGGHFPFFVHAIFFRVLSFTFMILYLNYFAMIPIFLVWLGNIIIGYTTKPSRKILQKVGKRIKRMHSIKRKEANLPKTEFKPRNSPVWLNSFLSIVVPSCFMDISDPAIINESRDEGFKKEVYKFNRNFQQKVIGRQIVSSTLIILGVVAIVFYLINNPDKGFKYNLNIFYNNDFNIFCAILGMMGFISFLFARNIDVFDVFGLNESGRVKKVKIRYSRTKGADEPDGPRVEVVTSIEGNPEEVSVEEKEDYLKESGLLKFFVSMTAAVLVLSPIIAGCVLSSLTSGPPTYVVIANEMNQGDQLQLLMAKVRPLHLPDLQATEIISGELNSCPKTFSCNAPDLSEKILLINMINDEKDCQGTLEEYSHCLNMKGAIILENKDIESKTSRPSGLDISRASFPILSMNYRDAKIFNKNLTNVDEQFTSIFFKSISGLLTDEASREAMFEVECEENACTSQSYPQSADGGIYFGCEGSFKKAIPVNIDCYNYGLKCPEVEAWVEDVRKENKRFEKCFGSITEISKYGPVKCAGRKIPNNCNEHKFWAWDEKDCKLQQNNATEFVFYSDGCSRHQTYFKCEDDQWGEFVQLLPDPTKEEKCDRLGKEDLRFCRLSSDCIVIHMKSRTCYNMPHADPTIDNLKMCKD